MSTAPSFVRRAALAAALLSTTLAQAASWQLVSTGTAVDLLAETATVDGLSADRVAGGTLQDLSAPGQSLFIDAMADSADVGNATLERAHDHLLSVDTLAGASTAALHLSMARSWSLYAGLGSSGVDGLAATQDLSLVGVELAIAPDAGQSLGSPVAVSLRGMADWVSNGLPGIGGLAAFGLEITDAAGTVLARYDAQWPAAGLPGTVAVDFQATAGEVLTLALWAHRDTGVIPGLMAEAGQGLRFEDALLFQGELSVSPVPEPTTLASLLAGLAVLAAVTRRRG